MIHWSLHRYLDSSDNSYTSLQRLLSFLLILYLIGLILAHTVLNYTVILSVSYILLLMFILNGRVVISRNNIFYYILLPSLIIIPSFYGDFSTFYDNLTIIVSAIINVIIYENFARIKLSKRQLYIFMWSLIFFSFFYAILTSNYDRIFFLNKNAVPVLLLLMLFISDLYFREKKLLLFSTWVFAIFFILASQSRAGLLGIVSYFVFRNIKSKRFQVFLFTIFIIILTAVYIFHYLPGLLTFRIFGKSVTYLARRDILWNFALNLIPKYPFGMGYKGYSELFESVLAVSYSVHNTYLNILLQFGYVFFMIYIVFLVKLIKDSRLNITLACIFSVYLRAFFESATPFGFSLSSALLILPFYMEKGFLSSNKENKKKIRGEN